MLIDYIKFSVHSQRVNIKCAFRVQISKMTTPSIQRLLVFYRKNEQQINKYVATAHNLYFFNLRSMKQIIFVWTSSRKTDSFEMKLFIGLVVLYLALENKCETLFRFKTIKCISSGKTLNHSFCFIKTFEKKLFTINIGLVKVRKLKDDFKVCQLRI